MKTWLVLGVLIATILQAVPKQADKPQPDKNDSNHLAEQPPKPATAGTENVTPIRPSPDKKENSANSESRQATWCEKIFEPVRANWPLIAVAIWGILVARSTLHAIRWQAEETAKATQAMRDSIPLQTKAADAAKTSADALINAERPWISATVQRTVRPIRRVEHGQPTSAIDDISFFRFIVKNHGKTPAEIFAVRAKTERTKKGIDGGLTSDGVPDYGADVLRHVKLLAPNEEWEPDLDTVNLFIAGDPNLQEISNARLHVIFWGVVLYRDQFRPDAPHETRFCYTYLQGLDDYRPSGPSQYTRYT